MIGGDKGKTLNLPIGCRDFVESKGPLGPVNTTKK